VLTFSSMIVRDSSSASERSCCERAPPMARNGSNSDGVTAAALLVLAPSHSQARLPVPSAPPYRRHPAVPSSFSSLSLGDTSQPAIKFHTALERRSLLMGSEYETLLLLSSQILLLRLTRLLARRPLALMPGLGAPVVTIGGAGTFDGIFLSGILGALCQPLQPRRRGDGPARKRV
jgi:hypothetical protein